MESPFLVHFDTNYIPSDDEVESIENRVIPPALEEYERLEATIRDLSIQRDNLEKYIGSHRALISPARRIPYDIVQSIFLACIPAHRNAVMTTYEAPLLLGRICSAWRAIALSTPKLWASIHIHFDFVLADERRVLALKEWLERSVECPLSLSILACWPQNNTPFLVDILLKVAHRWRRLELTGMYHGGACRELADADAPKLEIIRIHDELEEMPTSIILSSPRLTDLQLSVCTFQHYTPSMLPPTEHLLHLSLTSGRSWDDTKGMSGDLMLAVLRRYPRLVSLKLQINDIDHIHTQEPVSMLRLRSLSIFAHTHCIYQSLSRLLDLVIMPELRYLELPRARLALTDTPLFCSLRQHTPCIESLSVDLVGFTEHSLHELLSGLPSIKTLSTYGTRYADSVSSIPDADPVLIPDAEALLTLLTPPSDDPGLTVCPVLSHLKMWDSLFPSEATLLTFLQRRAVEGGEFRDLDLDLDLEVGLPDRFEFAPDIEPFLARGVRISLYALKGIPPKYVPSAWGGLEDIRL